MSVQHYLLGYDDRDRVAIELSSTLHMSFDVRSDRPLMGLGSRPLSRLSRCLVAHGEIAKISGRAEAVQNPRAEPLIY